MEFILAHFYYIVFFEYSLLFLLVTTTRRVQFFRLLYISTRETILLTLSLVSILICVKYFRQGEIVGLAAVSDFLRAAVSSMSEYYVMLLFLFYGTAISFNIVRQASSFWPVISFGERLRLVIAPLGILLVNLYMCGVLVLSLI
ncbi:MAG: hypothetical protein KDD37_08540 [Bdellovibrionales bacterium]|nr:hypothetical protein [Bdellovibrionales bacterium]